MRPCFEKTEIHSHTFFIKFIYIYKEENNHFRFYVYIMQSYELFTLSRGERGSHIHKKSILADY